MGIWIAIFLEANQCDIWFDMDFRGWCPKSNRNKHNTGPILLAGDTVGCADSPFCLGHCRLFGWTKGNEITNGRWVMFGFAVGLLTEYATGVDFPHQFALMASYLGLTDFFD